MTTELTTGCRSILIDSPAAFLAAINVEHLVLLNVVDHCQRREGDGVGCRSPPILQASKCRLRQLGAHPLRDPRDGCDLSRATPRGQLLTELPKSARPLALSTPSSHVIGRVIRLGVDVATVDKNRC
ncbi:MAG: hypothetical protein R2708_27220 [Vicinamibacterales bacterium]